MQVRSCSLRYCRELVLCSDAQSLSEPSEALSDPAMVGGRPQPDERGELTALVFQMRELAFRIEGQLEFRVTREINVRLVCDHVSGEVIEVGGPNWSEKERVSVTANSALCFLAVCARTHTYERQLQAHPSACTTVVASVLKPFLPEVASTMYFATAR